MARPKSIADDAILDAALGVMQRHGPEALTFAAVGKAVGLAPATLVQRYATKAGLQQAALLRAWDQLDALTAEQDASAEISPEGAVAMLVALFPSSIDDQDYAEGLLMLREDMRDPLLRARGVQWRAKLIEALGRRLSRDPDRQERLGRLMASQWQGAQIWWAFSRSGPPDIVIGNELREWCRAVLDKDDGP